jgi:hypothetical protein
LLLVVDQVEQHMVVVAVQVVCVQALDSQSLLDNHILSQLGLVVLLDLQALLILLEKTVVIRHFHPLNQ